jgi:hypothetical protein
VGANAASQKAMHATPRFLYPEHRRTIQRFISAHRAYFRFIEIGTTSFAFEDATDRTGIGLESTIGVLRRCGSYFGMHSGMMHLATALGIACTIVVNFPPPYYLPGAEGASTLSGDRRLDYEMQWLYPQHRYLHEDAASGPQQITEANLESALPVPNEARGCPVGVMP